MTSTSETQQDTERQEMQKILDTTTNSTYYLSEYDNELIFSSDNIFTGLFLSHIESKGYKIIGVSMYGEDSNAKVGLLVMKQ